MTLARSIALLLLSCLALAACDRFRHAKYERSPWGAPDDAPPSSDGSSNGSSNDAGAGASPVVVGVFPGGSGGAGGSAGCGLTFEDTSCEACMEKKCCAAEAACAADRVCSGIGACIDACAGDATCVAACDSAYASNIAAGQLDACLGASCASDCN